MLHFWWRKMFLRKFTRSVKILKFTNHFLQVAWFGSLINYANFNDLVEYWLVAYYWHCIFLICALVLAADHKCSIKMKFQVNLRCHLNKNISWKLKAKTIAPQRAVLLLLESILVSWTSFAILPAKLIFKNNCDSTFFIS